MIPDEDSRPVAEGATLDEIRVAVREAIKSRLEIERDPVVEAVRADLLSRSQVGIRKYGVTLARDDLSLRDWAEHAMHEALDQALYLKRIIMELDKQNG